MKNILNIEIKKAFRSKTFIFAVFLGLIIAILQIIWFYFNIYKQNNLLFSQINTLDIYDQEYGTWYETGILEAWLGCEGYSPFNQLYYVLFPLIAALPYGWSLFTEWKNGYINQMITRISKSRYMISKYISVFISGGITVTIPLILNFIINACYIPCIGTDAMSLQVILTAKSFGSELYFNKPVLYVLVYLLIDFIIGGIYACIALLVTHLFDSPFTVLTFPLLLHCCLLYGIDNLFMDFSPYNFAAFINPAHTSTNATLESMCVTIMLLLLFVTGIYYLMNKNKDVIKLR